MDLGLAKSVAVVVGGASGIGLAIAKEFAQEGAAVVVLDRDAAALQQAVAVLGCPANHARTLDVTDAAAVAAVAEALRNEIGLCHHVVYAAGMGSGKFGFPFWNLKPADWPRVMDVNLQGAVNTLHAFVPQWIAAEADANRSALLLSSVAAQIGSQTDPPYSAAKTALLNFMEVAAKDLAPYGVRVNGLCPGMVQTPLNRRVWQSWNDAQPENEKRSYEDWAGEKVKKIAPLGRWQTPEDMAAAAVFLASKRAHNITGQTLNVDGGQVMHW
ncbi:MAG: SDR family NAD(P)-dependent oxidoreductase [Planctomycetaceae bacterium]